MRKDTRPVLLASSLPLLHVERHGDGKTSIVCPDCRTWRMVAEGRIFPHPGRDGKRCDASARRFALDVRPAPPAQRRAAVADAARRRAPRAHVMPSAPVPVPVHRPLAA